ncbi:hypothetical protein [Hafnia alvei]|uniref:hypothetical protein n=1 Tax=Hafnia alvei TaxID=569 RepID=UPI000DF9DE4F|nr:hypothetical protein [Hafnia alvei]STQ70475.1 Uncharacterised protein [Hafnia alvei]
MIKLNLIYSDRKFNINELTEKAAIHKLKEYIAQYGDDYHIELDKETADTDSLLGKIIAETKKL